jgi:HTH-type transcriptional regulator / antitoxin HipB
MVLVMVVMVVMVVAAICVCLPSDLLKRGLLVKRDKCHLSCITDKRRLSSITDMKKKADAVYPIKTPGQLGAVLQGFRKQRGLTQAQVAHASGLVQSAVSELELDSSTASLSRIFKLLAALDVELVIRSRDASRKVSEW